MTISPHPAIPCPHMTAGACTICVQLAAALADLDRLRAMYAKLEAENRVLRAGGKGKQGELFGQNQKGD